MTSRYSKQPILLQGWDREEQFTFFKNFDQPFFNVHTEVDLTPLYAYCKRTQTSVFLAYLYVTLQAARTTENFLYRLEDGKPIKYDGLDISTTLLKDNQTIAFAHFPFQDSLTDFCASAQQVIQEVKSSPGLFHGYQGPDNLHVTTLPWFPFKGMEHAFQINQQDPGIPKIAFGRLETREEKVFLPLSIALHHALGDGFHVHLFLENMAGYINAFDFAG
ncbi:chloramphenicol acetyltransferase [Nibribacter ruber]|uniref:Chloramphenicol acetyltransferase n=1 Tax=Nibribacter ruber TaxID=2698458 RepID=A0A6P1P493_9BACT|nr:CatA-like O-acetyltransferase [Nibribacter ruber]QHL89240.1 chloramphenicol acetyltransferase [Nibribacter ruber]